MPRSGGGESFLTGRSDLHSCAIKFVLERFESGFAFQQMNNGADCDVTRMKNGSRLIVRTARRDLGDEASCISHLFVCANQMAGNALGPVQETYFLLYGCVATLRERSFSFQLKLLWSLGAVHILSEADTSDAFAPSWT